MKKPILFVFPFLTLLLLSYCGQPAETDALEAGMQDQNESLQNEDLVKRGEYLIGLMDCHACHTPKTMTEKGPAPDMSRMLSGYPADQPLPELVPSGNWVLFHPELTAAVGPWGITFAANLTPHESGLGNWSLDQFKYALQNGKHMGMENGRPILPPMPWEQYKIATDEDLEAMYAYLQSIPAVDNVVPAPVPPTEL